jgi:hypothetical protein
MITVISPGEFNGVANLEKNQIASLCSGVFSGLPSLILLYLGYNQISSLSCGTFRGLPKLLVPSLRSNRIASLSDGVFSGIDLVYSLLCLVGRKTNEIVIETYILRVESIPTRLTLDLCILFDFELALYCIS